MILHQACDIISASHTPGWPLPCGEPTKQGIPSMARRGCDSLRAIAAGLEQRSMPAARGGKWSAVQVARLLEAAAIPFDANPTIPVA